MLVVFVLFFTDAKAQQYRELVNPYGKCIFAIRGLFGMDGQLVQNRCGTSSTRWSYNNPALKSQDRHICDKNGDCVAARGNSGSNVWLIKWGWRNEAGQRFTWKPADDLVKGYFRIVNDYGKCLSVGNNSEDFEAVIVAWDCNTIEKGQLW